ncbi:hypothetical protein BpHYR1_033456 [Brachionus plicatilis]|uniref:Uncharacterized protein n=1 Tax=Brachionus plicatilis TaxID=10195 RepID=A0A3M7PWN4_BRAPC|nr:hypothetical protein BpHYR1_033456 [Brachionus plicatilis]
MDRFALTASNTKKDTYRDVSYRNLKSSALKADVLRLKDFKIFFSDFVKIVKMEVTSSENN